MVFFGFELGINTLTFTGINFNYQACSPSHPAGLIYAIVQDSSTCFYCPAD